MFNDTLMNAVVMNTRGASEVMMLADSMKELKSKNL
jgi:hypothetical protein